MILDSMNTRTKAILGLSGVFLIGLLCGALGVGLVVREKVRDRDRLNDAEGFRDFFSERLELSESQRDSLALELEQAYNELDDIREVAEYEYDQVFDTLTSRISPLLDPDQRMLLQKQRSQLLPRDEARARLRKERRTRLRLQRESHPPDSVTSNSAELTEEMVGESIVSEQKDIVGIDPGPDEAPLLDDDVATEAFPGLAGADVREEQLPLFLDFLKERLELNDEQVEEVRTVLKKGVRRNAWISENFKDDPPRRLKRQKMNLLMLAQQINQVLTDEQKKVFKELLQQMKKPAKKSRKLQEK